MVQRQGANRFRPQPHRGCAKRNAAALRFLRALGGYRRQPFSASHPKGFRLSSRRQGRVGASGGRMERSEVLDGGRSKLGQG